MRSVASARARIRSPIALWHRRRYLNKREFKALESRVVWIFGSPRTGSTWLMEMLAEARAPGVATINETWAGELFNRAFAWPQDGTLKLTSSAEAHANIPGWVLAPERESLWRPVMRAFLLEGFQHQLVHGQARTGWMNPYLVVKEPNTSEAADTLVKLLPRSRVLFLIRDGRDVMDSLLDLVATAKGEAARDLKWDELSAEERENFLLGSAASWVYRMDMVQRACELVGPESTLTVRYEDLLAETPAELVRIARWLGVDDSADWAAEVAERHAFEHVPADERGQGKFHRAATPGLWRENMGPAEQAVMQETMGDKLRELGYDGD
ncbi:MAG: sulfotransferase [Solirubrobacterales bacterium]